jgi:hypothetical protein
MKLGAIYGWFVPELRKMNGNQLLKVWGACTSYSRNWIYLHCILLLACCSVIFNLSMRLTGSIFLDLIALVFGLTVPPNLYFAAVLGGRREQVRRFVEEHWEEFNS